VLEYTLHKKIIFIFHTFRENYFFTPLVISFFTPLCWTIFHIRKLILRIFYTFTNKLRDNLKYN